MHDFSYELPPTLPSRGVVKVDNVGDQIHMAAMVKLDLGATVQQVLESLQNSQPPPGDELEFLGNVSPGHTMYFEYDLAPAGYVSGCFVPDVPNGGMPHAAEGMIGTVAAGATS